MQNEIGKGREGEDDVLLRNIRNAYAHEECSHIEGSVKSGAVGEDRTAAADAAADAGTTGGRGRALVSVERLPRPVHHAVPSAAVVRAEHQRVQCKQGRAEVVVERQGKKSGAQSSAAET